MQAWTKKGCIYTPKGQYAWNQSHAQVPVIDVVNHDIWRIYYASRDQHNCSRPSYVEVEAGNPSHILYEYHQPILELGRLGTFDDSGIMPSCILQHHNQKYLFYIGWTKKQTIPYHNAIGLAISTDQGRTFTKFAEGPILDITYTEPYFTGTSFVMVENGLWRMWYLSCTKWESIQGKPEPFYHIKYAESADGIRWIRKGLVAIDYQHPHEAIASASVIREASGYRMWYCYRNVVDYRTFPAASYRIGYAESSEGITWMRKDHEVGLELSPTGWDSEMLAYPYVISANQQMYMFYNGNGFGKTGLGYAILNA
jgi:hypothetical protein